MKSVEERFWEKVKKTDYCWIWQAGKQHGYGVFSIDGKPQKAHRVAWFLTHGYYPEPPYQVNHRCNNPPCVNPEHLYEGTAKQNQQDSIIAGTIYFKKGHKINAKLTQEDADKIRELWSTGKYTRRRLVNIFGVSQPTISNILNGKTW